MNRISFRVFLAVGLLLSGGASTLTLAAEFEWLGWLGGPDRSGWVGEFQPPKQWPDKLTQRWQVSVGTGYGTPLVKGDRVYQHGRQGNDEVVQCIDLESGEVIWSKRDAVAFKVGGGGEFHGKGPKSCPAYSDGRIFTLSISGVLIARNAETGEELWRRDYSSRYQPSHPYWGVSTSPLISGDHVVVHFGNDREGVLVALDVTNGNEVWTQGNHGASYSSAMLVEIEGVEQIVEWNHDTLAGVHPETGEKLWEYPFPHVGNNQNMPTPTFHEGRILLGGENRGLHSIEPRLDGSVWSARARWHQEEVALDMSSAVINDGLLYGFSHYDSGRLFCVDPESGKVLWKGPPRTGSNVMFLSIPGYVVALIDRGKLQIITASGEAYDKVAEYTVSDGPYTWAPPVLLSDCMLIKDKENLTRWELR